MDDAAQSGANLALVLNDDVATMSEVLGMVKKFLSKEYLHVLTVLRANRALLDALAKRLEMDRIVDQAEMRNILQSLEF